MYLYGASGHGKVIIDILEANNTPIDYIVDDNPQVNEVLGYEVRRNTGSYDEAIISIGSAEIRRKIVESIDVKKYPVAMHPTAVVSPRAKIGEGTVVMQGAIIQTCVEIGKHCIINTGAVIEHDNVIGDYVHISPKVALGGTTRIGELTHIGIGAAVINNINISKNCVVGAGAVVVDNLEHSATYVGVPARKVL